MSKVKFISVQFLRDQTPIEDNVDADKLTPWIYKAQDTKLQQALGTTFYDRLKQGTIDTIEGGANPLNALELALIKDYIKQMLVEWTFYLCMPHLNYKMTNKAVSQENAQFSNPSALDEIKYLRANQKNLAEFYTKRLIEYLCDHTEDFPEYNNPADKENLHKSKRAYSSGIAMPKGNKRSYSKFYKRYTD